MTQKKSSGCGVNPLFMHILSNSEVSNYNGTPNAPSFEQN